jgi:hypothetical protein
MREDGAAHETGVIFNESADWSEKAAEGQALRGGGSLRRWHSGLEWRAAPLAACDEAPVGVPGAAHETLMGLIFKASVMPH